MTAIIVQDGVEYEIIDYRKSRKEETILSMGGNVIKHSNTTADIPRFILKKKKWKPMVGDMYYFVTSTGKVERRIYDESLAASLMIEQGNCFKTYDEAEKASTKIKALLAQ